MRNFLTSNKKDFEPGSFQTDNVLDLEELKDHHRPSISVGSDQGKPSLNKTLELETEQDFNMPSLLPPARDDDAYGLDLNDMIQNQIKPDGEMFEHTGSLNMNEGLGGINLLGST